MRGARNALLPAHDSMQDVTFDQVFPATQRFRSFLHWTPVDIAKRAVALLAPTPDRKVLDVGSGVGKVCLIGAASTRASWFGIERDAEMVHVARAAASRLNLDQRAQFLLGDIASIDWSMFDAFYFFNPFAELLTYGPEDALTRRERYVAAIDFVQRQLSRSRAGTRVVTYHGFGSDPPPGYDLVHREYAREDELCLWIRQPTRRARRS
jgi:SAM-dependent methyltransferase